MTIREQMGSMNIQLFAAPGEELDLEALLNEANEGGTPPPVIPPVTPTEKKVDEASITKIVSERIKAESAKIREEERLAFAKLEGHDTYESYVKSKERKTIEDKGFDPEAFEEVAKKVYDERRKNDPDMKELAEFRAAKAEAWGKAQIEELSTLLGKQLKMEDVGQDVLNAVKPGGSIVEAYMAVHGRELIKELRTSAAAGNSKGSTNHLFSPGSSVPESSMRSLTPEEQLGLKAAAQYCNMTDDEVKNYKVKK
jgi:hypothetical protein